MRNEQIVNKKVSRNRRNDQILIQKVSRNKRNDRSRQISYKKCLETVKRSLLLFLDTFNTKSV